MAEITKADVGQAVRNELANFQNEMRSVRDAVQRIDQRTNDLDDTQREVKELYHQLQHVVSQLQTVMQQVQAGDSNASVRTQNTHDTKLRVQNIERGIAEIVQYLHASHQGSQESNSGQNPQY
ncbi:MAG: hypothetical protein ACTJG2_02705 [Candidatus Saccharimonadales bacterium]